MDEDPTRAPQEVYRTLARKLDEIPSGFPSPSLPRVGVDDLWPLLLASIGLTWVTLTDTVALSRGFAGRLGDDVDPNMEIRALGVSNAVAGLFQGFPASGSSSRTTTAHAAAKQAFEEI